MTTDEKMASEHLWKSVWVALDKVSGFVWRHNQRADILLRMTGTRICTVFPYTLVSTWEIFLGFLELSKA
jgi:hypothetical protein